MIPNFITWALKGEDLQIYGDGSYTRSVCYVTDLVDGIYRLMRSDVHIPVNLGNTREMSVLETARKIISLAGSKSRIVFAPPMEDDPKERRPDLTRARTLLGWEPRIDPEEGLKKTIEWFREH
jgi:dTDP-glucose 4,6-dehydratase